MRFVVIKKDSQFEEYLVDYIEAPSWYEARSKAINKYGKTVSIKIADDKEFEEYDEKRLNDWANIQMDWREYSSDEGLMDSQGVTIERQKELEFDNKRIRPTEAVDRDLKKVVSLGRPPDKKFVTTGQLRRIKGEVLYSVCVDCGAEVPYSTRPHERCEKCRIEHRRLKDRERKRLKIRN